MLKVTKEIISDSATAVRHVLSGVLLLAGFNVCIAVAAFLASVLVADPGSGLVWFYAVMGFHGTGLVESFRQIVEVLNWCAFGAIFVFAGHSFYQYCSAASRRPTARVIQLPVRRQAEVRESPRVVNL